MATQLDRSITTLINDGGIAHAIVHGGPTETVQTEGGPVRTFAKLIADNQAAFDQAAEDLTAIGTTGGAGLVGTADGSNVQAALDAVPAVASAAVTAGVNALKAEYAAPTGAGGVGTASGLTLEARIPQAAWTPAMFGIPLNSEGVDYTAQLQALLDTRNFVFPPGFTASCKTLYVKSYSVGDFKNAKLKLMPGMPAGTQVIMVGSPTFGPCDYSVFYGVEADGNREFQSQTGSGGVAGGDGGMHGIHFHNTTGVRWYGPKANNCGTDGMIIWARKTGPYAGAVVKDLHIYSPVCDNNTRQGMSFAGGSADIYDPVFTNTHGRAPQAGLDIEPNVPADEIDCRFHGRLVFTGNAGRGIQVHTPGGKSRVKLGDVYCSGNLAIDCQIAFYVAVPSGAPAGSLAGVNTINYGSMHMENGLGITISNDPAVTSPVANDVTGGEIRVDGGELATTASSLNVSGKTNLGISKVWVRGDFSTTNTAPLNISGDVAGVIDYAYAENTNVGSNSIPILMGGAGKLVVSKSYSKGSRGISLVTASNKKFLQHEFAGALLSFALRIRAGSVRNEVNGTVTGTLTDSAASVEDSNDNDVFITAKAAARAAISVIGTSAINRCRAVADRTVNAAVVAFGVGTTGNFLYSSQLSNTSGTGLVTDAGTGNKVYASWPLAINSAS